MPSSMIAPVRIIDALEIGRLFPQKRIDENKERGFHKVYTVSGCCFFINATLFKKMGAFDENVFLYNDENILGVQCKENNYVTGIDLDAVVIHEHAASSGIRNDFVSVEYLKSFLYYWNRYRGKKKTTLLIFMCIYCMKMKILSRKYGELHPDKIKTGGEREIKKLFND